MKKYSVNYLILASLLVLASCSSTTDSNVEEQVVAQNFSDGKYELSKSQFESSEMRLGKIEMKPFHEIVKATGVVDVPPENKASVSSYFAGTVKDIQLLTGQHVKEGQLLFTLENPDFIEIQQDFLEAQGQLTYLKSDYERQKNLVEDNISSQKNFLKAESDYNVTRVKMESLGKKLMLMNINPNSLSIQNIRSIVSVISPIDGFVTRVDITRGSFLNNSKSAITIVNTDHLHLELNIFEKDWPKVKVGQPIQFRIQEERSQEYAAIVHLVNKTIDLKSRTIGIHGHLSDENTSVKFSPGMYVEADIYTTSESKPSLPVDALVEVDGEYYVLILKETSSDGYSFTKKEVKTGESSNGFVSVLNGSDFNENTQFLIKGAFNLITD